MAPRKATPIEYRPHWDPDSSPPRWGSDAYGTWQPRQLLQRRAEHSNSTSFALLPELDEPRPRQSKGSQISSRLLHVGEPDRRVGSRSMHLAMPSAPPSDSRVPPLLVHSQFLTDILQVQSQPKLHYSILFTGLCPPQTRCPETLPCVRISRQLGYGAKPGLWISPFPDHFLRKLNRL